MGVATGGPQAQPADYGTKRAVRQPLAVDPDREPGSQGGRSDHPGLQFYPEADWYLITYPAIGPYDGEKPLELPALSGQVSRWRPRSAGA